MSFVLQFVEQAAGPDGATWRGALQEVESNTRHPVADVQDIVTGLAAHGVALSGTADGEDIDIQQTGGGRG